jgi:hypothetical protein
VSLVRAFIIRVMAIGAMTFTLIPCGCPDMARARPRPRTAAFAEP